MPNIKSQIKRAATNDEANAINSAKKTRVRTAIKAFNKALNDKDIAVAEKLLVEATALIDRAKSDGIYHANTAARKISRLNIALNKARA